MELTGKRNSILWDTNGRKREDAKPVKIATFEKGDTFNVTVWYDNGDVMDNAPLLTYKKYIASWKFTQFEYYRGEDLVYISRVYAPYNRKNEYIERSL